MVDNLITYETLYDLLRKEKNNTELQELDPHFHEKVVKYLNEKKDILKSQELKDSIFTTLEVKKTRKQIENIKKIIKELYEKRESKIVQLALMNSRTKSQKNDGTLMLHIEKEMYNKIISTLDRYREDILHNLALGNSINHITDIPKNLKKDEKTTTKQVRFMKKTPRFIGTDLKDYGPFDKGDKGNLPLEIANLLIKSKQVKEIKDENPQN